MKPIIFPVNLASEGARDLAKSLDTIRVRPNGKYKYKNNHLIINWGVKSPPKWNKDGIKVLNHWDKVKVSSNKLSCLKLLQENKISIPLITEDINIAKQWIKDGHIVLCRTKLQSRSGGGIVIAKNENEITNAPLYSRYKKKKTEYRIVVVNGVIVDFTQKKKKVNWDGVFNNLVRSHNYGWVMTREGVNPPKCVLDLAINAIKVLGLDFGSADIIYNELENKAYCLEINSAPGLCQTSLERYSNAFASICKNIPVVSVI